MVDVLVSHPTAYGLASTGGSFADIFLVPLTQFFLDIYGWRGTMLLLGGIFSQLAVCGALLKHPTATESHIEYEQVTSSEDEKPWVDCADEVASNSCYVGVMVLEMSLLPSNRPSSLIYSLQSSSGSLPS